PGPRRREERPEARGSTAGAQAEPAAERVAHDRRLGAPAPGAVERPFAGETVVLERHASAEQTAAMRGEHHRAAAGAGAERRGLGLREATDERIERGEPAGRDRRDVAARPGAEEPAGRGVVAPGRDRRADQPAAAPLRCVAADAPRAGRGAAADLG